MEIDLEKLEAGRTFHSAVCVIGAGVAGLMLATRLAQSGVEVNLLEGGGLLPEARSQALYAAQMAAATHFGVNEGRFRVFGGSSTEWGGQLLPFTGDIFTPPPGVPSAKWPLSEADILPFYEDAQRVLGLDHLPFTSDLVTALGYKAAPQSPEIVLRFSKWLPFSQRNLARTLGREALAHPRVKVFLHANATRLERCPDESRVRIGSVRVVNYQGTKFSFTAERFVVCVGTVESSRLLLCSPAVPNERDLIGRYFHDHLSFHAATLRSPARERALRWLGPYLVKGTLHSAKLEASPALRSREGLLAVMAHLVIKEPEDSGTAAVRNLLRSVQHGKLREAFFANLLPTIRGLGDVVRLLYYARFRQRRAVSGRATVWLNIDVEQEAHAENRIRLSDTEQDALGMPRTVVEWKAGPSELGTASRFVPFVTEYFKTLGVELAEWDDSIVHGTPPAMVDTYHMMGGARMGADPSESVVDRDLKVHGVDNLYVASCAVFPSGSSSNPTFTVMALTLRLAEHLAKLAGFQKGSPERTQ